MYKRQVIFFVYKQDKNFFGFSERSYNKAVSYLEQENYEKAEEKLVSCIKNDPDYIDARLLLADIYVKDGKYDLALKLLSESISLKPTNEKFYLKYITTLTKQNKITDAMNFINSIKASYIVVKISAYRPANIVSKLKMCIRDRRNSRLHTKQVPCANHNCGIGSRKACYV